MPAAEQWKPVVGFPDYEVSDHGHVVSHKKSKARVLRPFLSGRQGQEHPAVSLHRDGRGHTRNVHRLVIEAFIGPRPQDLEVRHLDGDRMNPKLSNLQFGSHSENVQDLLAHGRHPQASKTHCVRGHEFTEENTRIYREWRWCRECKRIRDREGRQRQMLRAASVPSERAA